MTWSENCFIPSATWATKFSIIGTKPYVNVETLSTQNQYKTFETTRIRFEIIISWKKYQSKMTEQEQSRYLDYLIDPSF